MSRKGHSAAQLAARWNVSEATATEWLQDFAAGGFAVSNRGYWYATRKAFKAFVWHEGKKAA